jgi:hypothetical protein
MGHCGQGQGYGGMQGGMQGGMMPEQGMMQGGMMQGGMMPQQGGFQGGEPYGDRRQVALLPGPPPAACCMQCQLFKHSPGWHPVGEHQQSQRPPHGCRSLATLTVFITL